MPSTQTVEAAGPQELTADRRRRWWIALATTVLVVGIGLSAVGALMWHSDTKRRDRQSFQLTASSVTDTLATRLRQDMNFALTVRGLLTMMPRLDPTGFDNWYDALEEQHQVGTVGEFLPLVSGPISDVPTVWQRKLLATARDTGQVVTNPPPVGGLPTLVLDAAVYRRGVTPTTVSQRRSGLVGWAVATFDLPRLLDLEQTDRVSVALYHRNPGQANVLLDRVGPSIGGDAMVSTRTLWINGPWTVEIRGQGLTSHLSPAQQSALVFTIGSLVSLILFLLISVLGRSRARALALLEEKTVQLRHQAMHDSLTGLPNRTLALDRAEQMLARARRAQMPIAALYIDIDGFKHINDRFGHAAGDEFLRIVAGRLERVIRESDTAARLAGDEFVVLLDASSLDVGPQLVAERVLEVLRESYDMGDEIGRQLSVTASIGVAHGLRGSAQELLSDADVALYVAKSEGRNRYVVFESGMDTVAQDRLTLKMDLADALESDELYLVYQPTFDLRSERPTGFEALLRWRHPKRGVIGPDVFIPIAEETGLIVPIGRWVLHEACRQAARWRGEGHQLGISVNVSGRQLDNDGLIDDVRDALQDNGLDAAALTLEITETALMRDADASAHRLGALKALGVRLAIDDFGTGYSSLAYLRQFSVDSLKIDRSFIRGVAASSESAALIHTLVRLGKTLNLETLAEGIEDHEQLRALQRQDCDMGQGFLLARPLEVEAADAFLDAHGSGALASG
ncbi:MAG: putative bifunctional diguanylate cyclase/phosphodiesterase [Solirubrobacteraceae bacterium]